VGAGGSEEGDLVGIGNAVVAAGEDDGDGGRDEGVGAPDDGGQARAEEALDQRVDAGDEQQRLDHPRLLLIAAAHLGDERGGDDDRGAEHDEVVLESEQDGLRCRKKPKAPSSSQPWRSIDPLLECRERG
jgi:hypothetical protein